MEKSWIHSGEGYEAQLVCIVHADPQPTVRKDFYSKLELNCGRLLLNGLSVVRPLQMSTKAWV